MAPDPLAPLLAAPGRAALLFDVDGVLAPIAPRPERSRVPADWLAALARLLERYCLVACVSGRPLDRLRELVPVAGLLYAGNHGMELDDGSGGRLLPEVEAWLPRMAALSSSLAPQAEAAGGWLEDKGPTLTLHWRQAPAARAQLE